MYVKTKVLILAVAAMFAFLPLAQAEEMSSSNYTITSTVISGGGGLSDSTNYKMLSTIGQPSPLGDGLGPLYSGFIYTVTSCNGDIDLDGDIDGKDLSLFINGGSLNLPAFATAFGTYCP